MRAGGDARAARPRGRIRGRAAHRPLPHAERPRRLEHRPPRVHRRQRAAPRAGTQRRRPSCCAASSTARCASTSTASSTCPRRGCRRRERATSPSSPSAGRCRAASTTPGNAAYGFLRGGGRHAELCRRARPRAARGGRRVPLVPGRRGRRAPAARLARGLRGSRARSSPASPASSPRTRRHAASCRRSCASPHASAAAKPSTKTDPGWFSWRQRVAETRLRQEIRLRVGGRGRCRGRARSE